MAEYNSIINRTGAEALIPEEITPAIIQGVAEASAVLSTFKKLPNMASNVLSMPVLDMLPMAYFLNGDTDLKQTTTMSWDKKKIYAEEVAVIVPIPESVMNDAADNGYDIWGEVQPRIIEAFGAVIDNAVLFGVGKPTTWRDDIVTTATEAGNVVEAATTPDVFLDIFGEGKLIGLVEESGFEPNAYLGAVTMKGKLRGLRDENKNPLFVQTLQDGVTNYSVGGLNAFFLKNGAWDSTKALMIAGDFNQAVYSIRQDITYKLLTEGVIQDGAGVIKYNLAQQDMVALRVVMRLGWEIPNPVNALKPTAAERCPFAVYVPNDGDN